MGASRGTPAIASAHVFQAALAVSAGDCLVVSVSGHAQDLVDIHSAKGPHEQLRVLALPTCIAVGIRGMPCCHAAGRRLKRA